MKFQVGPTGKLIKGHLYDVNKHAFLRAAQAYDPLLYLAWNSEKRRGLGCWELWRRPEKLTATFAGEHAGVTYLHLKYVPDPLINHVMDIDFLSYSKIAKLKSMDTWGTANWVDELEYQERKHKEVLQEKTQREMRYSIKQDRRTFKVFKEMVASGTNPALLAKHWGQASK